MMGMQMTKTKRRRGPREKLPTRQLSSRDNYIRARLALGGVKKELYPVWSKCSPHTTWKWKAESFADCALWCWHQIKAEMESPLRTLGSHKVVIDAVCKGFGLAHADLMRDNRDLTFAMPRHVAVQAMVKLGLNFGQIGRAMRRDSKTMAHSAKMYAHFSRDWSNVEDVEYSCNLGLASVEEIQSS